VRRPERPDPHDRGQLVRSRHPPHARAQRGHQLRPDELMESAASVLMSMTPGESRVGRSDKLSVRERDVLGGLANGSSTEQIGVNLRMSPHTVRTHLRNIMRKLDANTRAHAVAIAIGDGAIEPPR